MSRYTPDSTVYSILIETCMYVLVPQVSPEVGCVLEQLAMVCIC